MKLHEDGNGAWASVTSLYEIAPQGLRAHSYGTLVRNIPNILFIVETKAQGHLEIVRGQGFFPHPDEAGGGQNDIGRGYESE